MNFECLDSEELESIGVRFETDAEAEAFADIIMEELEIRIGMDIADRLTNRQIDELYSCCGQEEARRYLETYVPEYLQIIEMNKKELEQEIIEYKDQIPGVI